MELLTLKWAVTEKLGDYLMGSKFTICTGNNLLANVYESKLRVTQILWLNIFALFNFNIKYRTGRLNQVADAMSCHPIVPGEIDSDCESKEYETKIKLNLSCTITW